MFEPTTDNPFEQFRDWYAEAQEKEVGDATAMTVATADADGRPAARIVLLKGHDARGFVFYTNLESEKGQDLIINPFAALCFHWQILERQVRIEGPVMRVSDSEADAYFNSRAHGSQIGAWASQQSKPIESKEALVAAVAAREEQFTKGKVPRPPHWSGFRVMPRRMEFWQSGEFRLHDRFAFSRMAEGEPWSLQRLNP
jgi:pyridoxamine 5'-phosphate oxidase